jgi:hypothetical protein
MSKDKFDWKGLFINEDVAENSTPVKEESKPSSTSSKSSFPDSSNSRTKFPESSTKSSALNENLLNTIVEMYESGFEGLNKPGYDFYEFFRAIKAVGSNDPQVYKMALTMAQSTDSKVTKSSLLKEADYYIEEIEKVHSKYQTQGTSKKSEIQESQRIKKENLTSEIASLEKKLMEIQNQISTKRNDLQSVDINMMSEVAEIDQKITANDVAKSKILETIMTVVNGIKNNV